MRMSRRAQASFQRVTSIAVIAVIALGATSGYAAAAVKPTKLSFMGQAGGDPSLPQRVTFTHTGDTPTDPLTVSISPPDVFTISFDGCSGRTLGKNGECAVDVSFRAKLRGTVNGSLTIGGQSVSLAGTGSAATATAVTLNLDFAGRQRGTVSEPKVATMKNTGDAPLSIFAIGLAGASPDRFAIDSAAVGTACSVPSALGINQSCSVGVRFMPDDDGPRQAALVFSTNDPVTPALQVALSGVGTPGPAATVSPAALTFTADVRTTTPPQQVTLRNVGSRPLRNVGVVLEDDEFAVPAMTCGDTLEPGTACTVDVTFRPRSAGGSNATLRFSGNDPAHPSLGVALTGTGTGVPVADTPADADPDRDGVTGGRDRCPTIAGSLSNGCPGKLNADVKALWRVSSKQSQLLAMVVRAKVGSRIELRCSGARKAACGFTKRIRKTTKLQTSLTRNFKGKRILPAGVSVIVEVTLPKHIGTYERLLTQTGRQLPKKTKRCLGSRSGQVMRCT